MKKFVFVSLLVLLGVLYPTQAHAQQDIRFDSFQIEFWPEYDRSAMLVIYRGTLDSSVPLPAELTIRLPADTTELNATAVRDTSGSLFSVANEREVRGEWAYITFSTTMPDIQIEFYDELVFNGSERTYDFQWPADYSVNQVRIELQQPVDVEQMITNPQLARASEETGGLVYYTAEIGAVDSGEEFDLNIQYEKVTDRLTVETLTVEAVEPITPQTDGHLDTASIAPWVIGGLGLVVIAGGAVWYFSSPKTSPQAKKAAKKTTVRRLDPELNHLNEDEDGAVYCHQCGKRTGPNDRFCRACGTKVRRNGT